MQMDAGDEFVVGVCMNLLLWLHLMQLFANTKWKFHWSLETQYFTGIRTTHLLSS